VDEGMVDVGEWTRARGEEGEVHIAFQMLGITE
jgi:hypothetical protein